MEKLELLGFYNKWWLTGKIPRELYQDFKRGIFSILEGGLPYASVSNRIISLIGLRRTGKTTILYQLIQSLLNKIDPKRVLFLNISDPLIANNSQFLEDLLKEYQKTILQENFSQLTEPVYIFFDEIQYLPGWELFLKRYIDLKFKIKFIITGSASLKIVKKSKESLVGRLDEQRLHPLSFREFIEFKYHKLQTKEKNLIIHFIYRNAADNNLDLLRKYHSYSSLAKKIFQKKT
jgi:predicted AAA+ superfamily ATPase